MERVLSEITEWRSVAEIEIDLDLRKTTYISFLASLRLLFI